MSTIIGNICIDAEDPQAQSVWWAKVLRDFEIDPDCDISDDGGREEYGLVNNKGTGLIFVRVPEKKSVKNRMHMCLKPADLTHDEEVNRLLHLGASMIDDKPTPERGWVVLADPEGNEFCVLDDD